MSLAQWNRTVETNLTGGFLVVREFVKRLVRVRQEQGEGSEALRNVSVVFVGSTGESFEHIGGPAETKERRLWTKR
jgi:NAD(P)-dependent dehydrogenase (short-subunit alcohol dehydrogenase family)